MKLPIPVNIITGALGVGKTTAVTQLLRQKPPDEKWALLVNEFGVLGIDAALVEASLGANAAAATAPHPGVVVRELAGGCLCCTLSGPLGVAIAQLVRQAKPDRLIIEPSGLGHPAGLLDTLYGEHLRSALDVKAVVCLVDVRAAAAELRGHAAVAAKAAAAASGLDGGGMGAPGPGGAPTMTAAAVEAPVPAETFQDQINVADVLVGHKPDLAGPDELVAFWRWAGQLYPPKAQVLLASHGAIDPALLDLPRAPVFRPLFRPQAHSSRRRAAQRAGNAHGTAAQATAAAAAAAGQPAPDGTVRHLQSAPSAAAAAADGPDFDSLSHAVSATSLLSLSGEHLTDSAAALSAGGSGLEVATAAPVIQLQPGRPLRLPSCPPLPPLAPHPHPHPHRPQQDGRCPVVEEAPVAEAVLMGPGGTALEGAGSREEQLAQGELQEVSCGWLFSSEDMFDRGRLVEVVSELWRGAARLKGIFRVGKSSYVVPYIQPDGGVELRPVSYRRESRLEVIVAAASRVLPAALAGSRGGGGGPVGPPAAAAGTAAASGAASAGGFGMADALSVADWDAVECALLAALQPGKS